MLKITKTYPSGGPAKLLFDKYAADIQVNGLLSMFFHIAWQLLSGVGIGLLLYAKTGQAIPYWVSILSGLVFSYITGYVYRHVVRMYVHQKADQVPDELQNPGYYLVTALVLGGILLIADYNGTNQVYRQLFLKEAPNQISGISYYDAELTKLDKWRNNERSSAFAVHKATVEAIHDKYDKQEALYKNNPAKLAEIARYRRDNKRLMQADEDLKKNYETIDRVFASREAIIKRNSSKIERITDVEAATLLADQRQGRLVSFLVAVLLLFTSTYTLMRLVKTETICGIVYTSDTLTKQTVNRWGLLFGRIGLLLGNIPIFLHNLVASNIGEEPIGKSRKLFGKNSTSQTPTPPYQNRQNNPGRQENATQNGQLFRPKYEDKEGN